MKNIIFTSMIKFLKPYYDIFNGKHLTNIFGIQRKSIHLLASQQSTVTFSGEFDDKSLGRHTLPKTGRPVTLIDNTSIAMFCRHWKM